MAFADRVAQYWPDKASAILAVIRTDSWRTHPAVVAWAEQCYHDPRESEGGRAECRMVAINAILDGYGVEALEGAYVDRYHHNIQATYVNFGDTYDTTILFDNVRQVYRVTSWGDFVQQHPKRFPE